MRVCVIDPSLFTPAYDRHLCIGLAETGLQVALCGRRLRAAEVNADEGYRFEPRCYPWTERGQAAGPTGAAAWLKAGEHALRLPALGGWLRRNFDVLHFQWSPMPAVDRHLWRSLARDRAVVFTVHDTTPFLGRPTSRLQGLGWRSLLDIAHGLIVHTESSRRVLTDLGIDPAKVHVVPHGPLSAGKPGVLPEPATPSASVPDGRRTILVFGEIKPYKGIDVLLRAAARLPAGVAAGWKIVVAGRPRCEMDELHALGRASPIPVEWKLGYIPDAEIAPLFRSADIVAFPYRQIDASGALMLALPFGVPVVASRVGVFGELLQDGVTGLLAAPGDPDDLARVLARAMSDEGLRTSLRAQVLDRVRHVWSWQAIARAHEAIYRRYALQVGVVKPTAGPRETGVGREASAMTAGR